MKNIKRGLCAVLFLLSFLSLSEVFSLDVSASSVYDNSYHTTNTVTVSENSCATSDVSANWIDLVTAQSNWPNSYGYSNFMSMWDNRTAWSIMQEQQNPDVVRVQVTDSTSPQLQWTISQVNGTGYHEAVYIYMSTSCQIEVSYSSYYNTPRLSSSWSPSFITYGYDYNYPSGYEGATVVDGSAIDSDGDGLNIIQELQQGTSDNEDDSDSDGIDDLKESVWFPDRDEVFCKIDPPSANVCAYPNPIAKDLYVEVDWMFDPSMNRTFKPTSTQLGLLEAMFANEGINFHADTGQFGGGNELPDYTAALRQDSVAIIPDFANYKNGGDGIVANFDSDRLGIWRYMIYGNFYSNANGISSSSGWAEVLGDDLFISGGVVENVSGATDADRAVANTIAHELGHNLCLSNERVYFEQDEQCVFAGIDNKSGLPPISNPDAYYNLEGYESVMNYKYQLTDQGDIGSVDYSHGPDGSTNHDDWSAVKSHIGGFNGTHTLYIEFGARSSESLAGKLLSADGLIIAESR